MIRVKYTLLGLLLGVMTLIGAPLALAAWPTTPLTTYVANSTPAIKAYDLNQIQDAIGQAFLGTYSFKALVLDGSGGSSVVPGRNGGIVASGGIEAMSLMARKTFSDTTTPTPTIIPGEFTKGSAPACWAVINGTTGGIYRGAGLLTTRRTSDGNYELDCDIALGDNANAVVMVTPLGTAAIAGGYSTDNGGKLRLMVRTAARGTGVAMDANFNVIAFGE